MDQTPVGAEQEAMATLGWSVPDLQFATVAYGTLGIREIRQHLAGDHLPAGKRAIILAALHDEFLLRGLPSPFPEEP